MALHAPYLEAIQAIPGDTPAKKFRWITSLIKEKIPKCKSLEEVLESEKLPQPLIPLIQVEAAKMLNKINKQDQSNYEAIAEALKSEDTVIVNRALRATCFFDGTNKNITNVKYFFDYLFPEISVNTRTKIIKKLGHRLARNEPSLAEEFFDMVASTYGTEKALPLLPACSESFIYNTILNRKLCLNTKMVEILFRKSNELVARWIELWRPNTDPTEMHFEYVTIYNRNYFLEKLVTDRLQKFVEICEMLENVDPPTFTMSYKHAYAFLKNGKEHFLKKPLLYFKMLPPKTLSAADVEFVFPKLFPKDVKDFKINEMLLNFDNYPMEKRLPLLRKTYREIYGKDLLEDPKNVIPSVLLMLPAEERVQQARIKLAQVDKIKTTPTMKYETVWTCYLPVEDSIPMLKEQIARTPEMELRAALVVQIIYSCKVNKNDAALLETLKYLRDRHKNEQILFFEIVLENLVKIYDLPRLSEEHWSVLFDILERIHVKNQMKAMFRFSSLKVIEAAAEYKIIHDLSLDPIIEMVVAVKTSRYSGNWNILSYNPEYERRCLESCLNVVSQKYYSDEEPWKSKRVGILSDLVASIYAFNAAHVKYKSQPAQPMSIKNYPWLLREVDTILTENISDNYYVIENLKEELKCNEKDLYDLWIASKEPTADLDSGAALKLLKKHPERILDKWPEYLKVCKKNCDKGSVRRFIHTVRWYKDIPVKFAEQCYEDVITKKDGPALYVLALLLHGHTFAKFVEPYVPRDKTMDVHHEEAKINYSLIQFIPDSAKAANPPVPLDLLGKMCEGDYLSMVIGALINLCKRTALPKAIAFAKMLATKRVSVRKHGVRLLDMVAPQEQFSEFLLSEWKSEVHYSIRQVFLNAAKNKFLADPGRLTWHTLSEMISSFTTKDEVLMNDLIGAIARTRVDYVADYLKLLLQTIDKFERAEIARETVISWTNCFLKNITPAVCNNLPDEFAESILKRFLFHSNTNVSATARSLVIKAYLLPAGEKFESRMKAFANVFHETVKMGWDVPHPEKSYFYPVNYAIHKFVHELVPMFTYLDTEKRLIDGILKIFVDILSPGTAPVPYLFLVYAKERMATKTPEEFGVKLGEKLPELAQIFTPLFVSFMADGLQDFLVHNTFKDLELEDIQLGVMEGLTEVGSIIATLMAVSLLNPSKMNKYTSRYERVVKKLKDYEHPAVRSIFCENVNRTGCS